MDIRNSPDLFMPSRIYSEQRFELIGTARSEWHSGYPNLCESHPSSVLVPKTFAGSFASCDPLAVVITRSIGRRIVLRSLSVIAALSCIGMACVALGLSLYPYGKSFGWPSSDGNVVSISHERVSQVKGFHIVIGFHYAIHGYERIAYYSDWGTEADARRLSTVFAVGTNHVIRYNPQDFDDIQVSLPLTMEAIGRLAVPIVLSVFCGIVARWFWSEASG